MIKHFTLSLFLLLMATYVVSCGNSSANETSDLAEIFTPTYAKGYRILSADNHTSSLIRVVLSGDGENDEIRELFIRRDDEPVPDGYKGQILQGEARRIVCMSAPQTAMLHLVDATDRIVGISQPDRISAPDIRSRRAEIGDIGHEGEINYDLLSALKPDLVLLDAKNGVSPMEKRLEQMGVPYLYIDDWNENSPLGKAEWMMAVAESVGRRNEAEEVFREIPEKYNALKQRVIGAAGKRPKVMLDMPSGGFWTLPPKDSYFATLLDDAGAEYLLPSGNSGAAGPVGMDEAFAMASQADKWLNLGPDINTPADLRAALPRFANLPVIGWAELYNNTERMNAGGGNDFYESGTVNPDLVLRDFIKIMHPSLVPEPFTYYRRLLFQSPQEEDEDSEYSDLADIPDLP